MRALTSGLFFGLFFVLTSLWTSTLRADGTYQWTRDGAALVWNNHPDPGDAATWSGAHDADGYATGFGTLTWFSTHRAAITGSNISGFKRTMISSYSGKMVRGKLDGPIENMDANGRVFHGNFVDGRNVGGWRAGRSHESTSVVFRNNKEGTKFVESAEETKTAVAEHRGEAQVRRDELIEPAPPAAGPAVAAKPEKIEAPAPNVEFKREKPMPTVAEETVVTQKPAAETNDAAKSKPVSDSVGALINPPALLRTKTIAAPSPQPSIAPPADSSASKTMLPRLSETEVNDLADAEARAQGFDLSEYQREPARFVKNDETWTITYMPQDIEGEGALGTKFVIRVEDKSKKAAIVKSR